MTLRTPVTGMVVPAAGSPIAAGIAGVEIARSQAGNGRRHGDGRCGHRRGGRGFAHVALDKASAGSAANEAGQSHAQLTGDAPG